MHAWPHNALARPHFVYLTRSVDGNHYWKKLAFLKFSVIGKGSVSTICHYFCGQWAIGLLHDFLARASERLSGEQEQQASNRPTQVNATAVRIIRMKLTTWQLSIEFG